MQGTAEDLQSLMSSGNSIPKKAGPPPLVSAMMGDHEAQTDSIKQAQATNLNALVGFFKVQY